MFIHGKDIPLENISFDETVLNGTATDPGSKEEFLFTHGENIPFENLK